VALPLAARIIVARAHGTHTCQIVASLTPKAEGEAAGK
jgi:hypothetical protein